MFQNMTNNYEEERIELNIKEVLSKIFSIQNIIIYILTLMISMVGFGVDQTVIAPFGLALVAASISNGIPMIMVYLSSLIGTAIKFGASNTLMFIFTSIVMLLLVLIKKPTKNEEENEKIKLGAYLFISIFLVQAIYMIFRGFYFYDLLVAITLAISSYIFYKIFVNSLDVIGKYGIKRVFSIEEIIGASLLIAISAISLTNVNIFSFSIRNIICIFLVLLLGWRNGILVGGISGTTIGIVLGIIGNGDISLISAYAISGMLAGLLNKFGKIGVIVGFILGNILITYCANGGVSNLIMFQEILIASVGLLAMPKKTKITIDQLIPNTMLLPEAGRALEGNDEAVDKLNSISKTISELSNNYKQDDLYEKNEEVFEEELLKALDGYEENLLYDDICNNEEMINDFFDNLMENGILTQNAIISIFAKHNIFLMSSDDKDVKDIEEKEIRDILKVINTAYRICKTNLVWQKKLDEANKNMSSQLNNVKTAIENITEEMVDVKDEYKEQKEKIFNSLKEKNIYISDIKIKKEATGKYIINVYSPVCQDSDGNLCPIKQIQKVISNILNEKLILQDQKCGLRLNREICSYTYASEDKYLINVGIAKAKKDGENISGDMTSNIKLGDGKYLVAISDGMGTGNDARKNSKIAISMLERLLSSGFEKKNSIKLINSAVLSANKEDNYTTLDIGIFDLYSGNIEIIKSGACPTYFKRKRNVSLIKSNSLPTGIMQDIKIDTYDKDLADGDIIVICSDGIIDSSIEYANRDLWLKYLLEDIQTDIPERIADIILKESIDNCVGKPKDDMTVIVAKVIKK